MGGGDGIFQFNSDLGGSFLGLDWLVAGVETLADHLYHDTR